MDLQKLKIYLQFYSMFAKYMAKQPIQQLSSVIYRHTYRPSTNSRNVVVIGGSFAGSHVTQRLAHTLPSGYRVVLVEKNSHLHYAFGFPRNAVFSGREPRALIPYDDLVAALSITASHINLADGIQLNYDYLIVATGAAQPPPTRLQSTTRDTAIAEPRGYQQRIHKAEQVAVVGAGAAGKELVTEIRAKYPAKKVSLVHSRDQLLPRFGPKLHSFVVDVLRGMDIEVILGERLVLPAQAGKVIEEVQVTLSTGETKVWDLIIPCTGLQPNSGMLAPYMPKSIASNGEILVKPTLQVDRLPSSRGNIFALGDVAQTGGLKQGRAAMIQGEVVLNNIFRLINNQSVLENYEPLPFEGAL
ncbi:hypothetical protein B0J13DRAFT_632696 [Dactylonectria estremocensis]|uniref:FAD/NAD(P)-binding domain-containing protein n=1 Tax=Dactylonectria estremocensis TaxID=1079267 RepID=A0A9P9FJ90_9HYPO|nr:hypothetical protein B0J13DRAFT_632696 [Dactylonectria estremocensis]